MIVGNNQNKNVKTPLELISESPFKFYPTGSRFFGGFNSESDYDYFTEYSPETYQWLFDNAFSVLHQNYFKTMELQQIHSIWVKDNVHVQLSTDIEQRQKIQKILLKFFPMASSHKSYRNMLWEAMYRGFHIGFDAGCGLYEY